MPTGGQWLAQNKVRPGAYINFKAVPKPLSNLGERGVVAIPLAVGWGAPVIELFSTDLLDGKSLKKIGMSYTDESAMIYRLLLSEAYKAYIYRTDTGEGAAKATATIGDLKITAKWEGEFGNRISIAVVAVPDTTLFDVETRIDAITKETQRVANSDMLIENDYVVFSKTSTGVLTASAGTVLTEGASGTLQSGAEFIEELQKYTWNTLAVPGENSTVQDAVIALIKQMRDNEGRKVQAVLREKTSADYEGIISVSQGFISESGEEISPDAFVAYVAGLTAGANVVTSRTNHVIPGALVITESPQTDDEIKNALLRGEFVLSYRSDGKVVVEQDINTHTTYTPEKGKAFSKNRVIRCLDEINNSTKLTFERSYLGKVNNDETGRGLLKADLVAYANTLQSIGAIQNFDASKDIEVLPGEDIDAVVVNYAIQPVDSMEKLYMTVMVG